MMKRLFFASVFAVLPASSHAADVARDFSFSEPEALGLVAGGTADVSGGYRWVETDHEGGQNSAVIGGAVRYSIPVSDAFSLQIDADGEYYFTDDDGPVDEDENIQGLWLVGAHASWRDPARGLLGVFGAVGSAYNTFEVKPEAHTNGWMVGGEGQVYHGDWTFYAQAGYADFPYDLEGGLDEGFVDGWFVRGLARLFVGTDSLIEAEFSYGHTDAYLDPSGFTDNGEIWNWGIKGKKRLGSAMPIYGVLGYRGGTYYADQDLDRLTEHVVYAGISVMWGASSLRENDRRAATLDMPLLPLRASGITESLD